MGERGENAERGISRRQFLKLVGAGSAGLFLAGTVPSPLVRKARAGAPKKPIRVRFWHNAGGRQALYVGQAKTFQELRPDIEVQVVFQGGGMEVVRKAQVALAAGDPPECTFMFPYNIPTLSEAGAIVPLDAYIKADSKFNRNDIPSLLWRPVTWKGQVWVAPKDYHTWVLHYNPEVFAQKGLSAPTTWEEFETVAAALTEDTNRDGRTDIYGIDLFQPGWLNTWLSFLYNAGGNFLDPKNPTKVAFHGPEGQAALELFDRILNKHKASPTKSPPGGLTARNVAMVMSGTFIAKGLFDTKTPFEVVRVPYKVRPMANVNINGWAVWKTDPDRQQATWDWLSFILSKGNYWTQIQSEYWIPIRNSHKRDPEFRKWLETYPQLRYQVDLPTGEFRPPDVTKAGQKGFDILQEHLEKALFGQIPLSEALPRAAAEVEKLLA